MKVLVTQSCLTLCDPMDCSLSMWPCGRAVLLGSLPLRFSTRAPLPSKASCFVCTCVSLDNSFPSFRQKLTLRSWKQSPFLQQHKVIFIDSKNHNVNISLEPPFNPLQRSSLRTTGYSMLRIMVAQSYRQEVLSPRNYGL